MGKVAYSREALLADDDFARPHAAAGYRLHGGFDAAGRYVSPRVRHRWPAVRAWQAQLASQGLPLIDASQSLLRRGTYPNAGQQKLLLAGGFGRTLWDALTVTGVIEARGRALCEFPAPDWQDAVVDDISGTCTGHLHKGLLYAHGMDEGGDPDNEAVGAHDAMWFAARDLVFGKDAWPVPEIPESISRPDEGPPFAMLPPQFGGLLSLLMNVLMIEVRAEAFFAFCCEVFRDPDNFPGKRAQAEGAAVMVERIREDEAIHVAYLQTAVSEMRGFTFHTVDGGTVRGADIVDPEWERMVVWHGETQFDLARARTHEALVRELQSTPEGRAILPGFEALDDRKEAA
mgnify:CR=1 FL=1